MYREGEDAVDAQYYTITLVQQELKVQLLGMLLLILMVVWHRLNSI
jgi:hypothetical protein